MPANQGQASEATRHLAELIQVAAIGAVREMPSPIGPLAMTGLTPEEIVARLAVRFAPSTVFAAAPCLKPSRYAS